MNDDEALVLSRPLSSLDAIFSRFAIQAGYTIRHNDRHMPNRVLFREGNPNYFIELMYHRVSREMTGELIYQDDPYVDLWMSGYYTDERGLVYHSRQCIEFNMRLSDLASVLSLALDQIMLKTIEIGEEIRLNGTDSPQWKLIESNNPKWKNNKPPQN